MSLITDLHPLLGEIVSWLLGPVQKIYCADFVAGGDQQLTAKADGTFVGTLDNTIAASCREFFGTHVQVVTEEDAQIIWPPKSGAPLILLDPLDGTHNHGRGSLDYGTMIAVIENGHVTASAILLPARQALSHNGLYIAVRGHGAFRYASGKDLVQLRVSTQTELTKAFLLVEGKTKTLRRMPELKALLPFPHSGRINTSMAGASTCVMHRGIFPMPADGLITFDNSPHDTMAPALLLEEAGATVTDFQGRPWGLMTRSFVAANPTLHAAILAAMRNI